jgi:ubiquinone/menaquinone biosynthesis C-methylase UbiE
MPDVYNIVAQLNPAVAEQLADAMELRATDPQQQAMLSAYLDDLAMPDGAEVLEIGCGTGAISRVLASRPTVRDVIAVDPSPVFLDRAAKLAADLPNISFRQADGRSLPLGDDKVDVVVLHTVLSHVPEPARVLAEAFRVLRAGGRLAAFDGDYNTMTVATAEVDPMQSCAAAMAENYVNDPWIVRRLPSMLRSAGFDHIRLRSHGYAQTDDPAYFLSIIDRGADALAATGRIGPELVAALKAEARRRVEVNAFFGHIAYASVLADKPVPN